jgi:hypothetical protein
VERRRHPNELVRVNRLSEKQIKNIYNSGPLSLIQKTFSVLGAATCFAIGIGLLWLMMTLILQAGLQLGPVLAAVFMGFMAFLLLLFGIGQLYPVCLGYNVRVQLNGSQFEVERPYPFNMLRQVIDRDRINSIEVIRQRKGGYVISVLYLFEEGGPKLRDVDTIGPFFDGKQAHAVADAIQAELLPRNRNESQLAQHRVFAHKMVARIVFGFLMVFELIVVSSIYSHWNRMTVIDFGVSILMCSFPLFILYRIQTQSI